MATGSGFTSRRESSDDCYVVESSDGESSEDVTVVPPVKRKKIPSSVTPKKVGKKKTRNMRSKVIVPDPASTSSSSSQEIRVPHLDLPYSPASRDVNQFSQPLFSEDQSDYCESPPSRTSSGDSSPGSLRGESFDVGVGSAGYPFMLTESNISGNTSFILPYHMDSQSVVTEADIGKRIVEGRICVQLPCGSQFLKYERLESVLLLRCLKNVIGWAGPTPTIIYVLGFVHPNDIVNRYTTYIGHSFHPLLQSGELFKPHKHITLKIICNLCLAEGGNWRRAIQTVREKSAYTFYIHAENVSSQQEPAAK